MNKLPKPTKHYYFVFRSARTGLYVDACYAARYPKRVVAEKRLRK